MDDPSEPLETEEPARSAQPEAERIPIPLRLTLQPSGLIVELSRGDTLVGRHSEANLRLALPDVSRRHCRLFYIDHAWQIEDLDSLNGVYVNELRVHQVVLHDRDTLRIGSFHFCVDLHSSTATTL